MTEQIRETRGRLRDRDQPAVDGHRDRCRSRPGRWAGTPGSRCGEPGLLVLDHPDHPVPDHGHRSRTVDPQGPARLQPRELAASAVEQGLVRLRHPGLRRLLPDVYGARASMVVGIWPRSSPSCSGPASGSTPASSAACWTASVPDHRHLLRHPGPARQHPDPDRLAGDAEQPVPVDLQGRARHRDPRLDHDGPDRPVVGDPGADTVSTSRPRAAWVRADGGSSAST